MDKEGPLERHRRAPRPEEAEAEDPVENLLNQTGCLEKHYKVQVGTVQIMPLLLNQTGCLEKHYKVQVGTVQIMPLLGSLYWVPDCWRKLILFLIQNCIADSADWRKCQKEVEDFRLCIEAHKKGTKRQ